VTATFARWQIGYRGKEENVEDLKVDYVMGPATRPHLYASHEPRHAHRGAAGVVLRKKAAIGR